MYLPRCGYTISTPRSDSQYSLSRIGDDLNSGVPIAQNGLRCSWSISAVPSSVSPQRRSFPSTAH